MLYIEFDNTEKADKNSHLCVGARGDKSNRERKKKKKEQKIGKEKKSGKKKEEAASGVWTLNNFSLGQNDSIRQTDKTRTTDDGFWSKKIRFFSSLPSRFCSRFVFTSCVRLHHIYFLFFFFVHFVLMLPLCARDYERQ